jgi:hypothetical protein
MSNIFITDVIGTGTYAIPSNDTQLANATTGFDGILSGVANLAYDRVLAWVEDAGGPGGAEGVRTLNCLVEKFTYLSKECPSETEVDTMTAAIEVALEADANITSIGEQQCHLFQAGAYFLWNRDSSGFLYPNVATDDVAVGPFASPNGKWFDDGDLVLGGNTMTGTEQLKVVGTALIDQDSDAVGLDIDSEATDSPLINLQPIVTNDRGDIAFGTVRTSDPANPDEGDVWYNSTNKCLSYWDGTYRRCLNSPGLLAGANQGYYDGNNDYARISGTGWKVYGSCYFPGTNISTPNLFRIIMSRAGTTGTIDVRLYDFTNALEIARVTVSASGKTTYTDVTLSNLPAAGAIFEVQGMKSTGGASNGYLHYWEFY